MIGGIYYHNLYSEVMYAGPLGPMYQKIFQVKVKWINDGAILNEGKVNLA